MAWMAMAATGALLPVTAASAQTATFRTERHAPQVLGVRSLVVPATQYGVAATPAKPPPSPQPVQSRVRIHPRLLALTADTSLANVIDTVIVVLRDTVRIPPGLVRRNRAPAQLRNVELAIIQVRAMRAPLYARLDSVLALFQGAGVLQTYWLSQTAAVRIPIGRILDLAQWGDVVSIEPKDGLGPPDSTNCYDFTHPTRSGREAMGSDGYFCCEQVECSGGSLALFDTGVYVDHVLLNDPDRLLPLADCVTGGEDCFSGEIYPGDVDAVERMGHGSKTAAIVSGNANRGREYQGVTSAFVESYRIFPPPGTDSLPHVALQATLSAFDEALARRHLMIVAELASDVDADGSLSRSARGAFDAGAVIVAANGNTGAGQPVPAPANAPWVLGIGAYCLNSGSFDLLTTHGRLDAERLPVKPDLVAPSGAVTVSGKADGSLDVYTETSGAAPFAAGAALLMDHCLTAVDTLIEAGTVYAHMILSGDQEAIHPEEGAGRIRLPQKGLRASWRGQANVETGMAWTIDLDLNAGDHGRLAAAIWWADPRGADGGLDPEVHSDIDLYLERAGEIVGQSLDYGSVFEKCATTIERLSVPIQVQIVISGFSIPAGVQKVFYAANLIQE